MGRPKGSKNEKADNLEAFAKRIEREICKANMKDQESMERLVCRLLTNGKHPTVAAMLAAKWVEWRYGKPVQPVTAEQTTTFVFDAQRPAREEPLPDRPSDTYVQ